MLGRTPCFSVISYHIIIAFAPKVPERYFGFAHHFNFEWFSNPFVIRTFALVSSSET